MVLFPDLRYLGYARVRYSKLIRIAGSSAHQGSSIRFDGQGAATAVLPDHFYTGGWTHSVDRFPPDTHFVLASDGLTGCFEDPSQLWAWLQTHRPELHDPQLREKVMGELHRQRHDRCGDDDISFVWVYLAESTAPESDDTNPAERRHPDAG